MLANIPTSESSELAMHVRHSCHSTNRVHMLVQVGKLTVTGCSWENRFIVLGIESLSSVEHVQHERSKRCASSDLSGGQKRKWPLPLFHTCIYHQPYQATFFSYFRSSFLFFGAIIVCVAPVGRLGIVNNNQSFVVLSLSCQPVTTFYTTCYVYFFVFVRAEINGYFNFTENIERCFSNILPVIDCCSEKGWLFFSKIKQCLTNLFLFVRISMKFTYE